MNLDEKQSYLLDIFSEFLENSTEKIIIELDNLVGILAKREGS